MKLIFIDVETTGLNPSRNTIHQLSGCVEIDGELMEEFNYQVRPVKGKEIDSKALEVAGVTQDQILKYPSSMAVFNRFIRLLKQYISKFDKYDKAFFVAYNAGFDVSFVRQWFADHGDRYFGSWFWSNPIDIMVLAGVQLMGQRHHMPNFKLVTTAKTLEIQVDESKAHDAAYDIWLTREIWIRSTNRIKSDAQAELF